VDRFIALDGLRAISILWIILGHTLTVSTSIGLLNPAAVLPPEGFLRHTSAQLLLSSRFAVDTFFFISGFLVVLSVVVSQLGGTLLKGTLQGTLLQRRCKSQATVQNLHSLVGEG
jgi:peptidoglycan/LPS O-acetylase OafA/YrhL